MPEGKRVGIWIRVSTEDQARGESPEHHERRARHYAEAKGWLVQEVYHLEAVSGKSVMDHPEAQRMLRDTRSGHITGLIFSKLARLARNTKELLEFADIFREYHADLISLQESIDTSTPAGRLLYTMIAALAAWEREEIADRVRASIPIRAKLGKPLSGATPFGYRWEQRNGTKVLSPDPAEAPVRRVLYELFAEHRRLKTVARLLNERGHRTRAGQPFSDTTVRRLIVDPTAKGTRRSNYLTQVPGKAKNSLRNAVKPQDQWVWTEVEPIVDEALWAQCNALLAERQNGRRPDRRPRHVFAGFVYCHCPSGQRMYVPWNSPKYRCHACQNKVHAGDLDAVFQTQLKNFVLSPDQIAEHLTAGNGAIQEREELLQSLEAESTKLRASMDRAFQAFLDEQLTSEAMGRQYRPLEERLRQLEAEIPRLQAELDFMKIEQLSSDQVVSEAQDLASRWPQLPDEEKRKVVENVTDRITVGRDEIRIDLYYLPATPETTAERQRHPSASRPRRRRPRSRGR